MVNTEYIGISWEIALCDVFNIPISESYRSRGDDRVVSKFNGLANKVKDKGYTLVSHVAGGSSPIDFLTDEGKTVSVKAYKKGLTKLAPQIVGQPTSNTFFKYFNRLIDDYDIKGMSYEDKSKVFKQLVFIKINDLLAIYWSYLSDTDIILLVDNGGTLDDESNLYLVSLNEPNWQDYRITYTKDLDTWNESLTVKANGVSIGEFQVHSNRDCFKFRFNIKGLVRLGLITL